MKRKINYLMAALTTGVLLAGCSNEPAEPTYAPGAGTKTVTFIIPGANKGMVTYAPPLQTQTDEDKLDHLDIYMFDGTDKKLEWVFENSALAASGSDNKTTIDVTERKGSKVFFFVGNGNAISTHLKAARYGETTVDEFRDMISDKQDALPVIPLLMTAETEVADIATVTDAEKKVILKRRVARFDIDNDEKTDPAVATNFGITKIMISNVNQQGYFFDNATRTAGKMATGTVPTISFGTGTGHNEGHTPAVFYTYPTELGSGLTEISLAGHFTGDTEERIFHASSTTPIQIEANKRYVLKAKKITPIEIKFEISIKAWDDGQDLPSEPHEHTVEMIGLALDTGGDGVFTEADKTLDISAAAQANLLKFQAKSYRENGTKVEITYIHGNKDIMPITVNNPQSIITYNAHYLQSYEVTIPAQIVKAPAEALVELVSVADPRERVKIIVKSTPNYNATTFKPVLLGNVWWAPLNVGATTQNTAAASTYGQIFQWGRAQELASTGNLTTQVGPITNSEIPTVGNKFIITKPDTYTHDWLAPQDDGLWSGSNRRGPCPVGWRIPTVAELQKVVDIYTGDNTKATFATGLMSMKSDDDASTIWFPLAGVRVPETSVITTQSTLGEFSCADVKGIYTYVLSIKSDNAAGEQVKIIEGARAAGRSVRCVLDE